MLDHRLEAPLAPSQLLLLALGLGDVTRHHHQPLTLPLFVQHSRQRHPDIKLAPVTPTLARLATPAPPLDNLTLDVLQVQAILAPKHKGRLSFQLGFGIAIE